MATLSSSHNVCSVCKHAGCDVRLKGCGCTLHITCCPLSLILDANVQLGTALSVGPVRNQNVPCEVCKSGTVTGIEVLPLDFSPLQKAVKLRIAAAQGKPTDSSTNAHSVEGGSGTKRGREDDAANLEVEATHVVFSQGKQALSTSLADSECHRTGRWAEEEVAFVDHVVSAFDHSQLPLPHGTKLSSFLGDILLCKASRLTKKMKNAKLSTRSYDLRAPQALNREDSTVLNTLQDKFVKSMPSEYSQLEISFNLTKHWRSYFSDLCIQVGYPFLDGAEFLASLEEFERQSSLAEERMRNVRRRRMGFQLGSDLSHDTSTPTTIARMGKLQSGNLALINLEEVGGPAPPASSFCASLDNQERKISDIFVEMGGVPMHNNNTENLCSLDELESNFVEFMDHSENHIEGDSLADSGLFDIVPHQPKQAQGPFLEAIAMYLEQYDLPFQHADVWVPSFVGDGDDDVRILHAGSVTRRDQGNEMWSAFENFGEYSKGFTFSPGVGLVGRVYSTGRTLWEFEINKLDPKVFLRAGGAQEYGVRTATGIPFATPGVGRMVVILYSCNHIREDATLAHQCAQELSGYSPEPKWKLVIEIGEGTAAPTFFDVQEGSVSVSMSSSGKSTRSLPASTTSSADNTDDGEVGEIITLLGEQLAVQSSSMPHNEDSSTSSDDASSLFHDLMSIRLMLLRPPNRRTTEENEMIDVLRSSYRAYSAGNRRKGCELATLLAREWVCLGGNRQSAKTSPDSTPQSSMTTDMGSTMNDMRPLRLPSNATGGFQLQGMGAPPVLMPTEVAKRQGNFAPKNCSIIVHDHSFRNLSSHISSESVNSGRVRSISDTSQSLFRRTTPSTPVTPLGSSNNLALGKPGVTNLFTNV